MIRSICISAVAMFFLAAAACGEDLRVSKGESKENYDKTIQPITKGIARARTIVLYEGLPHPGVEGEVLKRELKTKKNIKIHEFAFYEQTLNVTVEDAKKLAAILSDPKNFKRYEKEKKCDGYHPDWGVKWTDGENTYEVFICLGCDEARLYGPNMDVYTDLAQGVPEKLFEILRAYRKNRPQASKD